jgi:hypothetical protein
MRWTGSHHPTTESPSPTEHNKATLPTTQNKGNTPLPRRRRAQKDPERYDLRIAIGRRIPSLAASPPSPRPQLRRRIASPPASRFARPNPVPPPPSLSPPRRGRLHLFPPESCSEPLFHSWRACHTHHARSAVVEHRPPLPPAAISRRFPPAPAALITPTRKKALPFPPPKSAFPSAPSYARAPLVGVMSAGARHIVNLHLVPIKIDI